MIFARISQLKTCTKEICRYTDHFAKQSCTVSGPDRYGFISRKFPIIGLKRESVRIQRKDNIEEILNSIFGACFKILTDVEIGSGRRAGVGVGTRWSLELTMEQVPVC